MATHETLIPTGDSTSAGGAAGTGKARASATKERVGWVLLVALVGLALLFIGLYARGSRGGDCPPAPFLPSSAASTTRVIPHMLGETQVNITVETRAQGPLAHVAFLNLHTNENTSVVAVRALQYYHGGSLTKFQHSPADRVITFVLSGANYTFDPNRMFTPNGIVATLNAYSTYTAAAGQVVTDFAAAVLDAYQFHAQKTVIGIHNNGPSYDLTHYLPGGDMANDSAQVNWVAGTNPHNFYFVTSQRLYNVIAGIGLNVVLQSTTTVTDDGSLSYYCFLQNVDYVNVEARAEAGPQGDQVIAQLDMFQRFTHAYFLSGDNN